jgi:IS5 family transposase
MAFHKRGGLKIEDMVRSRWVYRKLRNFRAGIEAGISCLKRAYGLEPVSEFGSRVVWLERRCDSAVRG